jgi:hypothetical protein
MMDVGRIDDDSPWRIEHRSLPSLLPRQIKVYGAVIRRFSRIDCGAVSALRGLSSLITYFREAHASFERHCNLFAQATVPIFS